MSGDGSVVSLHGGPTGELKRNEALVASLEDLLERARSGEVVGAFISFNTHDCVGGYLLSGFCGSYSMIGAAQVGLQELVSMHRWDG